MRDKKSFIPRFDKILFFLLVHHSKCISLLFLYVSSLGIRVVFVARTHRQLTVVDRFCLARESNGREFREMDRREERWAIKQVPFPMAATVRCRGIAVETVSVRLRALL